MGHPMDEIKIQKKYEYNVKDMVDGKSMTVSQNFNPAFNKDKIEGNLEPD